MLGIRLRGAYLSNRLAVSVGCAWHDREIMVYIDLLKIQVSIYFVIAPPYP